MNKAKFLRLFALIELFTASVFLALAIIFYLNLPAIGGDTMIPIIFAVIALCAMIAAPVMFTLAKKQETNFPNQDIIG